MNKLPLLPTTVVGSHAKPSWWHQCKGLIDTGEWGSQDLSELLDDAVDIAILDQERAGLDIITDGEIRRENYIHYHCRHLSGIDFNTLTKKLPYIANSSGNTCI